MVVGFAILRQSQDQLKGGGAIRVRFERSGNDLWRRLYQGGYKRALCRRIEREIGRKRQPHQPMTAVTRAVRGKAQEQGHVNECSGFELTFVGREQTGEIRSGRARCTQGIRPDAFQTQFA